MQLTAVCTVDEFRLKRIVSRYYFEFSNGCVLGWANKDLGLINKSTRIVLIDV